MMAGSKDSEWGFEGDMDFMQDIPQNTRRYSHMLRDRYNRFDPRVDFTQTLLFESAKELVQSLEDTTREVTSSFFLNDQVSSFQISVDIFSSNGRYGIAKKTLASSKNLYSQFTLPTTLVRGDKLDIPITVVNNRGKDQELTVLIVEYALSPELAVIN